MKNRVLFGVVCAAAIGLTGCGYTGNARSNASCAARATCFDSGGCRVTHPANSSAGHELAERH